MNLQAASRSKDRCLDARGPTGRERDYVRVSRIAQKVDRERRKRQDRALSPALLNERTLCRIAAAAAARIDPRELAAALGWPVAKLLAAERAHGIEVTVMLHGSPLAPAGSLTP